jgi:predicted adenylyl cyclase CyaB
MLEIEVKYYLGDETRAREVCGRLALPWKEGTFEVNRIFDYEDNRMRDSGALVRVRERGDSGWLTYKEKTDHQVDLAKVRLEYDTAIADPATAIQILKKLKLREVFLYERRRARHAKGGAHVEIDCLPGGWFCEIEADPTHIRELVGTSGLAGDTAIVWSYPEIFLQMTKWADLPHTDWTFDGAARGDFALPPASHPFWLDASHEL